MSEIITSRQQLTSEIRHTFPASHQLYLAFGGCTINVGLNSEELNRVLRQYFKPFIAGPADPQIVITVHEAGLQLNYSYSVKQPDPGKTKIKEEFCDIVGGRIVHKRLTGMQFIFGQGDNLAVGPCLKNPNQVINFINNRFIEWKLQRGAILGHAAGVWHKGRGLSLAGFSGMGKSTLALHLMSKGTSFVSNDRLLVNKSGADLQMAGVAKLPRVNPGTVLNNPDLAATIPEEERRQFAELPPDQLWMLEHKYDVDIDACFGKNRFVIESPMHGLLILNWNRESTDDFSFRKVSLDERPDLLSAFMKSTGLFYLPDQENTALDASQDEYLERLRRITVFEASGPVNFDLAALKCLQFLESGKII